jgi:hypothetical protein
MKKKIKKVKESSVVGNIKRIFGTLWIGYQKKGQKE